MNTITKPTGFAPPAKTERSPSVATAESPPVEQRIRTRAFELYLGRKGNGAPGDPVSDWLQAEREINGSRNLEPAGRQTESRTEIKTGQSKSSIRGEVLLHSDT